MFVARARLLQHLAASCILTGLLGCDRGPALDVPGAASDVKSALAVSETTDSADSPIGYARASLQVPIYSRDVAPLIEKYCLRCHDEAVARGGVALNDLRDHVPDEYHRPLLLKVADNLRSESMPPEGEPGPDAAELETLRIWVNAALGPDGPGSPRLAVRRLNRTEYNNTVRDLIGIDHRPADEFPADDVGYGFDNIGDVLAVPPILVEMYLASAERIIDVAFRDPRLRARIMNPPADTYPIAFRRYKPPVSAPREGKTLRLAKAPEDVELSRQQRIYNVLRAFADRAYRRPATHDELMRLLGIVLSAEKDGEDPETAIQLALRAVLASPCFLFRVEGACVPGGAGDPLQTDDFVLAARLSYFLWSSMPDVELYSLASRGLLHDPDTLRAQVRRLLADPKASALAVNFASQWLQTRKLKDFAPDPSLFPDFDESLRWAMLKETELFCDSIRVEDRSVLDFLDADYTFVNDRLARHYGISGVVGQAFRRVALSGTPRGGVLTQASVLAATSNPTRTSPVKRGKWILENILGTPPSPPPSGVEALKPTEGPGPGGTLRDRLEQHRANPACAACHRRMDPLGFGLENFDAVGGWRTADGNQPIDASGKLPGGRRFQGPAELRATLHARRDAFARCLVEKMLIYALGRGLERADDLEVNRIVARLARGGYRFSTLILAIAESKPFLNAHRPGESS
jgi:hypothetical protein